MNNEEGFTAFQCTSCHTEIEASLDMIGLETECPACGTKILVPDNQHDDIVRHMADDNSACAREALKSRTIRIELGDL